MSRSIKSRICANNELFIRFFCFGINTFKLQKLKKKYFAWDIPWLRHLIYSPWKVGILKWQHFPWHTNPILGAAFSFTWSTDTSGGVEVINEWIVLGLSMQLSYYITLINPTYFFVVQPTNCTQTWPDFSQVELILEKKF